MEPPVSSIEFWYYTANILGVGVLIKYAWDTNQIKRASLKQAEAAMRQAEGIPCVLVVDFPPDLSGRVRSYGLRNVGTGVALNITGRLSSDKNESPIKALSPGDEVVINIKPEDLVFDSSFVCTFESLSGTVYQSGSSYNKQDDQIVTDLRHTFKTILNPKKS